MLGKYLQDLGLKEVDTPYGWNPNDYRQESWAKQREDYGFDERETWSLDYTFTLWLYERLCFFKEYCPMDTYHKFEFKGETLSFEDCIDRMLEGLRLELTTKEFTRSKEDNEKIDNVIKIFSLCLHSLWW